MWARKLPIYSHASPSNDTTLLSLQETRNVNFILHLATESTELLVSGESIDPVPKSISLFRKLKLGNRNCADIIGATELFVNFVGLEYVLVIESVCILSPRKCASRL